MEKIFTEGEKRVMKIASDFRWSDERHFTTEGITPQLVVTVYDEWLEKILDRWNGVQFGGIFK